MKIAIYDDNIHYIKQEFNVDITSQTEQNGYFHPHAFIFSALLGMANLFTDIPRTEICEQSISGLVY